MLTYDRLMKMVEAHARCASCLSTCERELVWGFSRKAWVRLGPTWRRPQLHDETDELDQYLRMAQSTDGLSALSVLAQPSRLRPSGECSCCKADMPTKSIRWNNSGPDAVVSWHDGGFPLLNVVGACRITRQSRSV